MKHLRQIVFTLGALILFLGCQAEGDKSSSQLKPIETPISTLPTIEGEPSTDRVPIMDCPSGFIPVPTPSSTEPFCVMKYEAKKGVGTGANQKPVSQATGLPWVNISIQEAHEKCQSLNSDDDEGTYSLILKEHRQIIAQEILEVSANWSGAEAGEGQLNQGHSDNTPDTLLAAHADDHNAFEGTDNS